MSPILTLVCLPDPSYSLQLKSAVPDQNILFDSHYAQGKHELQYSFVHEILRALAFALCH